MFNLLKKILKKLNQVVMSKSDAIDDSVLDKHTIKFFDDEDNHGDFATNIGMICAKIFKKSPRDVADSLVDDIKKIDPGIEKVEIAGPGFINVTVNNEFWLKSLVEIINEGDSYGSSDIGNKSDGVRKRVNLEFLSANPTGPLHLGHVRGAIWGDSMSRILSFVGYDVENEYVINDLGGQINQLVETVYLRYRELYGEKFELKPGCYPGEYLIGTAKLLKEKFVDKLLNLNTSVDVNNSSFLEIVNGLDDSFLIDGYIDDEKIEIKKENIFNEIRRLVVDDMLSIIRSDLDKLGVKFHNWIYESNMANSEFMDESFDILKSKNLIYEGVLEKPKGYHGDEDDDSCESQTIFASTKFGDDMDRALKRSDGEWSYFAKDVGYHYYKIKRNYDWLILEVGIDHNGYKKRMCAAVDALSDGKQKFSFEFHNMVYTYDGGIQQKMSKRSGKTIGVDEIVKEIGVDVLRFFIFSKRHDVELDFDIKTCCESSKNNPYFYIQYAHARSCSILRNAQEKIKDLNLQKSEFNDIIINKKEKKLIKKLALWPNCVEAAASGLEPHKINFYLQDLATDFHSLWNLGTNDKNLRFINECKDEHEILMTKYRLNLVLATKQVMGIGLKLLGVQPLEEM